LADYTENGLLLADVKQLVKSVGQTVRSVGKASTEDGEGALWLVVSSTGGGGDDVDLIDFDNGLQGVRIENYLSVSSNLSDLGNIETARTNLSVGEYEHETKTLDGAFTSGTANMARIDKLVTISMDLSLYPSQANASTSAGFIPVSFRPSYEVKNIADVSGANAMEISIESTGILYIRGFDMSTGAAANTTGIVSATISYVIT